jgi:hypothetical protein
MIIYTGVALVCAPWLGIQQPHELLGHANPPFALAMERRLSPV